MILIKTACFGIWLIIMMFIMHATCRQPKTRVKHVKLEISDPGEAERLIRSAFFRLETHDRLIIEVPYPAWQDVEFIVACWQRKNPSIILQTCSLPQAN